jgi:hypothetical protein
MVRRRVDCRLIPGLVWAVACGVVAGCGGDLYVDKSYRYMQSTPPRLAIIPLPPDLGPTDAAFSSSFAKAPQSMTIVPLDRLRQTMNSDPALRIILDTILRAAASSDDRRDLKQLLNAGDLAGLRDRLEMADVLLLPVGFEIRTAVGRTFGRSRFRLYDLHTGSLVYDKSRDFNMNLVGGDGVRVMVLMLTSFARSDFDTYFSGARGPTR